MTTPDAVQIPLPEPTGWLIEYTDSKGVPRGVFCGHNSVGDYRDIDPGATSEPVYSARLTQAYAVQRTTELEARLAVAETDLLPLQIFLDSVLGEFPEHGDIDGFDFQEIAETCGLLKGEMKTVPCGEACACVEHVGDGETTECYQVQPVMRRARIASAKHTAALTPKEHQ